jgi:hypothetical protein
LQYLTGLWGGEGECLAAAADCNKSSLRNTPGEPFDLPESTYREGSFETFPNPSGPMQPDPQK